MKTRQVKRSEVPAGQTFYANESLVPCIALSDDCHKMFLKRYSVSDPAFCLHVYTPSGSISWCLPDSIVLIEDTQETSEVESKETTYQVELRHKSYQPLQGLSAITVRINDDGTRYCTAAGMGCSRNYQADCNSQAIRQFVAEHGVRDFRIHLPSGRKMAPSADHPTRCCVVSE